MNKKTLSVDDVYFAAVTTAMQLGSSKEEAEEYVNSNAFFDKLFDNLENLGYSINNERRDNRYK